MLTYSTFADCQNKVDKILSDLATEVFRIAKLDNYSDEFYVITHMEGKSVKLSVTNSSFQEVSISDLSPNMLMAYSSINLALANWAVNDSDFPLAKDEDLVDKFKQVLKIKDVNLEHEKFKI